MTKVAAVEEEEEAEEEETDEKFQVASNSINRSLFFIHFFECQVLKRALFHVGLSLSLIGYIFLGAELFRRIEGPVEVAFRHGAEREHEHQVSLLIRRLQRLVPNSGPNESNSNELILLI
jgi:hypothetical protein